MKVGVLQFFSWPGRHGPLEEVYARALERIEIMDRGGFDAVWLAEHHFTTFSVCPSVHMLGTLAAARTKRLRIGTAVSLAALAAGTGGRPGRARGGTGHGERGRWSRHGHRHRLGELIAVTISPTVIDPDDIETLQDLVVAAVRDANRAAGELAGEKMGPLTGGAGGPAAWACPASDVRNHVVYEGAVQDLIDETGPPVTSGWHWGSPIRWISRPARAGPSILRHRLQPALA